MTASTHEHHRDDLDWAQMAADLELEGDVIRDLVGDALEWLSGIATSRGLDVRSILDVGSGPGVGTCQLAERFPRALVTAVDGSADLLAMARRRAERLGLIDRIRTREADLDDDPELPGHNELVWASMVLHHVADQPAVLRRLASRLAPGGVVAIAEFGEPEVFFADDVDFGVVGLPARLRAGFREWIEGMRPGGADGDITDLAATAGLRVAGDRLFELEPDPPLQADARPIVARRLSRLLGFAADHLDDADLASLAERVDGDEWQRANLQLHASRRVYVLEATGDQAWAKNR